MCGRFAALRRAAEICRLRQVAVAFVSVVLFGGLFAQAADPVPVKASPPADPKTDVSWAGLGFGIGIAADFDVSGRRVVHADPINNIVRVTDVTSNVDVGFVLETHYFLRDFLFQNSIKNVMCSSANWVGGCNTDIGIGPFVAIEVNANSPTPAVAGPITGYALGLMVGLHHIDPTGKSSSKSSWNFGVGLRVDPKAQVLGDGFVPNQPLPPGETAIRYRQEPRPGIMLLSSFSW
jgi:hypothetical protein